MSRAFHPRLSLISTCLLATFILWIVPPTASAQNSYDIGTPAASKAGQSTASTYSMDKIETVNLANGNMSVHIPLVTIGGRGSASYTLALSYNSKLWSANRYSENGFTDPDGTHFPPLNHLGATFDDATMTEPNVYALGSGWSVQAGPALKTTTVFIQPIPANHCGAENFTNEDSNCGYKYVLTRLWLTLPDGSQVEMRDNATDGAPYATPGGDGFHPSFDGDRGRVWHSTDGSAITYITDANNGVVNHQLGGWVFLSDGTRLRMEGTYSGACAKIIDRNGNFVSFDYSTPGAVTYTDELGRQVIMTSNGGASVTITVKGYSGIADRVITIDLAAIGALTSGVATNLRADFRSLPRPFYSGDYLRTRDGDYQHTYGGPHTDLFPDSENPDQIDSHEAPTTLHLLDGRTLRFRYNQYGELAEIVYPGGGVSQIDYTGGLAPFCEGAGANFRETLNRKVVQRRLLTDGVNVDAVWLYSWSTGVVDGTSYPTATVEAHQSSVTGTLLASEIHYFLMLDAEYRACSSMPFGASDTGYEKWQNAKEFRVERQTGNGTVIEKRTWEQRASVVWSSGFTQEQPPNDPRVTVEDTILENGKMKRVAYGYDNFNNVTSTLEYDFGGTNGSLGTLVRQTFRTYGANIGNNYGIVNNGLCYSNLNPADSSCGSGLAGDVTSIIHQRRLLLNQTIKDAGGNQKAYSEFEYDNYNADSNHAAVVPNAGMIQYDGTQFSLFSSSNQPRGNVTRVSQWAGGSSYIYSFSQYDNAGNVVLTKDPKGNLTTASYTDNFGDGSYPDNGNTAPNGATFAFSRWTKNALNHQAWFQFDYTRGVPTGAMDPNGIISRTEYDSIGRPVRATAAVGLSEQTISEITYPSASSNVSTASKQLDANRWLASRTVMDEFDRVVTSWQAEDGQHANYASFTIRADINYDALGRVKQVSQPYRPGQGNALYTTSVYDLAGRVTSVTTPDNATVTTNYSSNEITVTDQAGKARKSVTDGLGRLATVYEDPSGVNYSTSYSYDTLDNLIGVNQDSQTRTFFYDSLKRLTSATNPESGTVCYGTIVSGQCQANGYDANGNLVYKTDARGVLSTYIYDALNRATSRSYSDGTPSVTYAYDSTTITNGKGRLASVSSSVSSYSYSGYDALGRALGSAQTIGSQSYSISNVIYDRAGHITSMTYPSGHSVNYNYDGAGRLGDKDSSHLAFTGNLGDGSTQRTYSSISGANAYDAASRMKQEQFGTTTPIYNKLAYNTRGQLAEMRASTAGGDDSFNRGKIVNWYSTQCGGAGCNNSDNNGNLMKQEVFIPNIDTSWTSWNQQYGYDSLNRLTQVHEYTGNTNLDWQQSYNYDRFGNRTIDGNSTKTYGYNINSAQATVSTATNRMYGPNETDASHALVDYDLAGNQTKDYLTSNGTRTYDAENRMISATDSSYHTSTYTYDGDGRRVKRNISGTETWQVYGLGGELLAEYSANISAASPQKEYGYRNGQLLVTADAPPPAPVNVALASNGGVAAVSSSYGSGFGAETLNNGDRKTPGWNDAAPANTFPDWAEVDFSGNKSISEIDVFMLQDNWSNPSNPTETMTFASYGLTGFEVQYWNGSSWATVPNGSVTGNNKVWRRFSFTAITTTKIKVLSTASPDGWSRLVEVEAWTGPSPSNLALASNGGVASVSSSWGSCCGAETLNNGDRKTPGWNDAAPANTFPDWAEVDFSGSKTINEIDVFSLQDNWSSPSDPTETMTFSLYGLTGYEVQYWNGSSWVDVPGGSVSGNNKVWRKFTFTAITTTKIRVLTNASVDGYSRLTEVEAWSAPPTAQIHWLVTDQLGTPRMIFDQTGSLANVSRHDYLPFGEELSSVVGLRSSSQGYTLSDNVRQKFTSKERDNETGLDYFGARYYGSTQGRFTGVDPQPVTTENFVNPQRWNQYSYVNNNPLASVDPNGGDGLGNGGDKVISVFLNMSQGDARDPMGTGIKGRPETFKPNGTYAPGPWEGKNGAAGAASANGYDLQLYGSPEMTGGNQAVTSSAFESALKNSEVVIYVGHGGQTDTGAGTDASPVHQGGIEVGDKRYYSTGSQGPNDPLQVPKPDVNAKVVVNFSCDASRNGGSYFHFTGKGGQLMVTINSGNNGVTNAGTLEKAAAAFVKVYSATSGDYEAKARAAAAAADKVVVDSYKKHPDNVGDRVKPPQKVG